MLVCCGGHNHNVQHYSLSVPPRTSFLTFQKKVVREKCPTCAFKKKLLQLQIQHVNFLDKHRNQLLLGCSSFTDNSFHN